MKKINSYKYIVIGLFIRYLSNLSIGNKRSETIKVIDCLRDELSEGEFTVSLTSFSQLDPLCERIKSNLSTEDLLDENEIKELQDYMDYFERIIHSEASTKFIYVVENRRYTTKYLLEEPAKIFPRGIWDKLSPNSQCDFKYAFFCIAFSLGTAAAFHMLRATEEVFRCFYKSYIKKNRSKKMIWGQMLDQLRNKKTRKPPREILEVLDIIRKTYRNPTNHPETFYPIDRAQDLLGLCIDVVNKMIIDMENSS